jgi:ribonuclease H
MLSKIEIYTDGSCLGNPGPGGYGVVIIEGNAILHKESVQSKDTTNNREELKAMLSAIKYARANKNKNFICYSDSAYVVNAVTNWIFGWARNGWKNSKKQIVENYDLMTQLYDEVQFPIPNLTIEKVKGHAGVMGNELADALATSNNKKYEILVKKYHLQEV